MRPVGADQPALACRETRRTNRAAALRAPFLRYGFRSIGTFKLERESGSLLGSCDECFEVLGTNTDLGTNPHNTECLLGDELLDQRPLDSQVIRDFLDARACAHRPVQGRRQARRTVRQPAMAPVALSRAAA
jgi:hypothetical protein